MSLILLALAALGLSASAFATTATFTDVGYTLVFSASDNNNVPTVDWSGSSVYDGIARSSIGLSLSDNWATNGSTGDWHSHIEWTLTLDPGYTLDMWQSNQVVAYSPFVPDDTPLPLLTGTQNVAMSGNPAPGSFFTAAVVNLSDGGEPGYIRGEYHAQTTFIPTADSSGITGLHFVSDYTIHRADGQIGPVIAQFGSGDLHLDVVKAVPEPETWVLTGLGVMALIARRRRQKRLA